MKWFRLYSGVLHDPKVQRLSPVLFKHWINLLCLANESENRGTLPEDVDDIAFALRIKPSEAQKVIADLERAGLVDRSPEGRRQPHNWPQRQRKSDDIAQRVGEHRARKAGREAPPDVGGNDDVTLHVTLPVTGKKLSRAKDTDSDTDSDSLPESTESNGKILSHPAVRSAAADADSEAGDVIVHTPSPSVVADTIPQGIAVNGNGHRSATRHAPTPPNAAPPPSPPKAKGQRELSPDHQYRADLLAAIHAANGNHPTDTHEAEWAAAGRLFRWSGGAPPIEIVADCFTLALQLPAYDSKQCKLAYLLANPGHLDGYLRRGRPKFLEAIGRSRAAADGKLHERTHTPRASPSAKPEPPRMRLTAEQVVPKGLQPLPQATS